MNEAPPAPKSLKSLQFGRIAPTVAVRDLDRALAFYCGVLGFDKSFENGSPVAFVILERDAAELHLTLNPAHQVSAHNVAHLMVSDASALYTHLLAHGVPIVSAIRDADYGLRTFVLADPDGNRIDLGEAL